MVTRQGYLHRISRAAALIDDAVQEMRQQRLNGENFSSDFRGLVSNIEGRLWETASTLRRAIEVEAQREHPDGR